MLSSWFNLVNNALSDLGHTLRSNVAPIFNLGLSLGGFIMGIHATAYISKHNRIIAYELIILGYSLILVGLFNEVYDRFMHLHFWVSLLFFLFLFMFLITYIIIRKTIWPMISVLIGVTAWALHFKYGLPRGAAIPELISVISVLPFYIKYLREVSDTIKH